MTATYLFNAIIRSKFKKNFAQIPAKLVTFPLASAILCVATKMVTGTWYDGTCVVGNCADNTYYVQYSMLIVVSFLGICLYKKNIEYHRTYPLILT